LNKVEDKDHIKEIFKERFDSFESPVDPKIWSSIESQIGAGTSATWVSGVSNNILSAVAAVAMAAAVSSFMYVHVSEVTDKEVFIEILPMVEDEKLDSKELTGIIEELVLEKDSSQFIEQRDISESKKLNQHHVVKSNVASPHENTVILRGESTEETMAVSSVSERKDEAVYTKETSTNVISKAPEHIVVEDQSKAVASPSGGIAPLVVVFSATSKLSEVKWKFDDGSESSEINPVHQFEEPGIYFVTMLAKLADGSVIMDKAVIEVKAPIINNSKPVRESSVFIPNIITPNGDGENDELIVVSEGIHSYSISIYSVNGKLVFQNDNPEINWDGKDLNGLRVEDGTYYYLINALGDDQKVYTPKGYLTVRGSN
jgi:gliding motility-associated-like protein